MWASADFTLAAVLFPDIVWLLPFTVYGGKKRTFLLLYACCVQMSALVAWLGTGVVFSLSRLAPATLPLHQVIQWSSILPLLAYTAYLFKEWFYEESDKEDVEGKPTVGTDGQGAHIEEDSQKHCATEVPYGSAEKLLANRKVARFTLCKFSVICIFGNLDSLAVYNMALLTHMVTGPQLMLTLLFSSMLVILTCLCASMLKPVVSLIQRIPLWCTMLAVCSWSLGRMVLHA